MRWWVLRVVVAGILLALLLIPFAGSGNGGDERDPSTITDYQARFTLARDGDLSAVETLKVDLPSGRHGIFRYFDTHDRSAPRTERIPERMSVTVDGKPAETEITWRSYHRFRVIRIGDPDHTVRPGEHTYVIRYRIPQVIEKGTTGSRSQLYWSLLANWQMPIKQADLTLRLPTASERFTCSVGKDGPCQVAGAGTSTLRVEASDLSRDTPVTVRTGLDVPTPALDELPWDVDKVRVLGRSTVGLGIVIVLGVLAGLAGLVCSRRTRESEPGFPLGYSPPEGISPAQASYLYTETVLQRDLVAGLMYAAEVGAITLDRTDDESWVVASTGDQAAWSRLDPATDAAVRVLVADGRFTAARKDKDAGKRLQEAFAAYRKGIVAWATETGLLTKTRFVLLGRLVTAACLVLAGVVAALWPVMSVVAIVPGLWGIGAIELFGTGRGTRRTEAGRRLWSQIGGFRRVMSTESAEARFDFAARKDLYTTYLPWAVGFGVADKWASKYRTETGAAPPSPLYIGGYVAGADIGSTMVSDFSSTVSSAISSYSSSSSGGGFSGGGGGGGGGGSW